MNLKRCKFMGNLKAVVKKFSLKNFFLPSWYSIFINPYFIARRNLYKHVRHFSLLTRSRRILDFGCANKPYKSLFLNSDYVGIDVKGKGHKDKEKNADVYFDGDKIPFDEQTFDVVLCTQVLEHVDNVGKSLFEIHRVLRSSGKLFLTIPLVWPEHEKPFDFRRFTSFELRRLLEPEFIIEGIDSSCGIFGVCGQLISAFLYESFSRYNIFLKLFIVILLCCPIQFIFLFFDFIFKNRWITLDYFITASRK